MRSAKKVQLTLIRRNIFSLGIPVLLLAMTASATNVTTTYITPAGSTTSGPVDASATFTTGVGFINVTLTNLEANPGDVGQALSGLSFTLSNGVTTGTYFESMGAQPITVNSGGTYALGTAGTPAGWGLNNNVSGGMKLNALGFVGPAGLIIGAPGAGGTYSNANMSIAGNPAHNPFLLQSVTFIVDIASVAGAPPPTVTSATFSFGTTAGQLQVKGCVSTDSSCGLAAIPEPITLSLTGCGLIGLFFLRRRRA